MVKSALKKATLAALATCFLGVAHAEPPLSPGMYAFIDFVCHDGNCSYTITHNLDSTHCSSELLKVNGGRINFGISKCVQEVNVPANGDGDNNQYELNLKVYYNGQWVTIPGNSALNYPTCLSTMWAFKH